jgi:hemolysin D
MGKAEPIVSLTPARRRRRGSDEPLAEPPRVDPDAVSFQPDALAIEEQPLPRPARSIIYVVVGLVVTALTWAALSQIDRVVVARGKLITLDPLIVAQPLETGVIRTINVGVGDFVSAGAVLVTLDPTFSESAEIANRERLDGMAIEVQRLEAEIYRRGFPPSADEAPPADKHHRLQTEIYVRRQSEYHAAVAGHDADARRVEAALVTNRQAQAGLQARLALLSELETMRGELLAREAGSKMNFLQSRLDRLALGDQLAERVNQERELQQQLAAARQQKERYVNNWIREAGEKLTSVREQLAAMTQQLAVAERRRSLVVLRAPSDGIVLELAQRSIGSVAKEAEPLVTLVPRSAVLEAEVEVDGIDISRLRTGDPVRLKLDALPFQRHGTIDGRLRVVTENSFVPEKGEARGAFFRARITLGPASFRDVPDNFRLIPGMATTAEILVGRRSVISYVLDPVLRIFHESLREP